MIAFSLFASGKQQATRNRYSPCSERAVPLAGMTSVGLQIQEVIDDVHAGGEQTERKRTQRDLAKARRIA